MKFFACCGVAAILLSAATAHAGSVRQITSGASDNASSSDYGNTIAWNYTFTSAVTEHIPVCSSAIPGALLTIADEGGYAGSYPIQLNPNSGTTINGSSSSLNITTAHQAITLQCDATSTVTSANWITVQTGGAPASPTTFAPITVQTIANLRSFYPSTSLAFGTIVSVLGYYAGGDGGGGLYSWSNSSSASDDGGSVIKPTGAGSGNGRWLLQYSGQPLSVKEWGAYGNATRDTTVRGNICASGSGNDDQVAIQYALTYVGGVGGELYFPPGTYRITINSNSNRIALQLPSPTTLSNDLLGGEIKLVGAGRTASEICLDFTAAKSSTNLVYAIDAQDAPAYNGSTTTKTGSAVRDGPRSFINIQDLSIVGVKANTADGGIRLFNPRKADIERVHIYGFPTGDALTFYAGLQGGAGYDDVQDSFFGWLDTTTTPFASGTNDAVWVNRGIVFIGNEDNNSKADESLVLGSVFYNCKLACVAYTGYDTDGNPGVPNPMQNGEPAGAQEATLLRDTFTADYSRNILISSVAGTGSTTSIICFSATSGPSLSPDGQLSITMTSGSDSGQIGIITGYNLASIACSFGGEIDVGGQFTASPSSGDTFFVGYRGDGVFWDAQDSLNAFGVYVEGIVQPFHLTANASNDFNKYGGQINDTNGVYIVSDAPLTGTVQGGSTTTIVLSSAASQLDGYYNGRFVQTKISTGATVIRQVGSYAGSTRTVTLDANAYPWGGMGSTATPVMGNSFTILGGPWPASMTGGQDRGLTDNRPAAYNYSSMWYLPSHVLQRSPSDQTTISADPTTLNESTIDSLFLNNTGTTYGQGRVVQLDTSNDKSVVATIGADQLNPLVIGGPGQVYTSGQLVAIARPGSEAKVWVYGCVNRGDPLVTSSHGGGYAQSDTSETNPAKILGYALTQFGGSCTTATTQVLARIR
jgi:hypothetical protein